MNKQKAMSNDGIEPKIIGNLLIDPFKISQLMAFLHPQDFSRKEHQVIYETMLSLTKQGPFDFITVAEELEKRHKLEEIGGIAYISSLVTQLQSPNDVFPSATLYPSDTLYPSAHEIFEEPERALAVPEIHERITIYSPSLLLLENLRAQHISLDNLTWRQLEEVVAELLTQDGFAVELGSGTKDEGKDLIAVKKVPGCGLVMSVWQAKKLKPGKPVGIQTIRELADTRNEHRASKGIIVTTTSLTKGALARIERDCYWLDKVDGKDLATWIQTGRHP